MNDEVLLHSSFALLSSRRSLAELPASTALSDRMSKELKRRGFSFAGSTICYAFMQATGMVNDHVVGCFRHGGLKKIAR
jgi:DNA-3-methyladenine glycosylase I